MNTNKSYGSIIFLHLNNGFSGSPRVLSDCIRFFCSLKRSHNYLLSSFNNEGFLSTIDDIKKININYFYKRGVYGRIIQYLYFQVMSAFCVYRIIRTSKVDFLVVNTIEPFLPSIIAKLLGVKVIYYLHEAYPVTNWFKKFLFYNMYQTSYRIICVSEFVRQRIAIVYQCKSCVIPNSVCITKENLDICNKRWSENKIRREVLMITTLKNYKGVIEYCNLSQLMTNYNFTLLCSESEFVIRNELKDFLNVSNLKILPKNANVINLYKDADLILNLSRVDLIFETFGLTILEGMSFGLPAIVPPVGGIAELVEDKINGFRVDSRDLKQISLKIEYILDSQSNYVDFSKSAFDTANIYSLDKYQNKLNYFFDSI